MELWWGSLTLIQQILALAAVPATIIMLLQTLLLLFGLGHHGGADSHDSFDAHAGDQDFSLDHHYSGGHTHNEHSEPHDGGLRIFTVRAFVAFFSIFGWLGIVLIDNGMNATPAIFISLLAGFAVMVGMAWFFKSAMRLQSAGNIDIRNSLGKTATVYIPIPPKRTGKGKVTVMVQGRFTEVDAVTDSDTVLRTGMEVVGVSMSNQNVLCVAPIQEFPNDQ